MRIVEKSRASRDERRQEAVLVFLVRADDRLGVADVRAEMISNRAAWSPSRRSARSAPCVVHSSAMFLRGTSTVERAAIGLARDHRYSGQNRAFEEENAVFAPV